MDESSSEWRLATGVVLAGGMGGERLDGTGFGTPRLGGASAVKDKMKTSKESFSKALWRTVKSIRKQGNIRISNMNMLVWFVCVFLRFVNNSEWTKHSSKQSTTQV